VNPKQGVLESLLNDGEVTIHLDPRRPGVDLPQHLMERPAVGLNLSRRYDLSVFEIDDAGVRADLRFDGHRYLCVIPWCAVFSIRMRGAEQACVYIADIPTDLRAPPPRGKPNLRIVH